MTAVKKIINETLQYLKSQCSVERNQQDSLNIFFLYCLFVSLV